MRTSLLLTTAFVLTLSGPIAVLAQQPQQPGGEGAQIQVQQPQPEVQVQQPAPQVTVEQPQPQVTVQQPEPEVTVQQAQPEVTVQQQGEPQVTVERQGEPQVNVQQPGQPQVNVQQPGQPQVNMQRTEQQQQQREQQQAQPGQQQTQQQQQALPDGTPVEQVLGQTVRGSGGEELGEITNFTINTQTGKLQEAIVQSGGVLGITGREVALDVNQINIDPQTNEVRADITEDQFENMPEFDYQEAQATLHLPPEAGGGTQTQPGVAPIGPESPAR